MIVTIKGISSPDVFDLETFIPEESDNFCFLLELSVGPKEEKGCEVFGITVCTPMWLITNHTNENALFGRHYLIVFEYNYQLIYDKLLKYISSIVADTWEEAALIIGRIGFWEFEDYQKKL